MKKSWLALVLALCVMVPGFAFAFDVSSPYGAIKLGYFMPNDDLDDFDSDIIFGMTAGIGFDPNIALELGWEYCSLEGDDSWYQGGYPVNADGEVTTWSIPITCKLIIPSANDLNFFVGAGIGWYDSEYELDYTLSGIPAGSLSDSDSSFGYHIVGGVDMKIDRFFSVGLELKWSYAKLDFQDYYSENVYLDKEVNVGGTSLIFVGKYLF